MLYHLSKMTQSGATSAKVHKASTMGERMARVRFLQMVLVISVEMKKEEYLGRHSFYPEYFHQLNHSI